METTASSSQRSKQTILREGIFTNLSRMSLFVAPKEGFDNDETQFDNGFDATDIDSVRGCDFHNSQSPVTHSHLGLINGRNELHWPDPTQWSEYDGHQISPILTLGGNRL